MDHRAPVVLSTLSLSSVDDGDGSRGSLDATAASRPAWTFADAFRTSELVCKSVVGDPTSGPAGRNLFEGAGREFQSSKPHKNIQRFLRIYRLGREQPHLLEFGDLGLSHILVVVALNRSQQLELLWRARDERLTVRQLRAVAMTVRTSLPKTGRPRTASILKTLTGPLAATTAFDGIDSLVALSPVKAIQLLTVCEHAKAELARAEQALQRAATLRQRARVLIVDSDVSFSRRALRLLRRESYIVTLASSAADAIGRFDVRTNCAVIEMSLPDGCSYALSRRLLEMSSALRCIYMTALSGAHVPSPAGVETPLVRKGSGLTDLRDAIAQVLAPPMTSDSNGKREGSVGMKRVSDSPR